MSPVHPSIHPIINLCGVPSVQDVTNRVSVLRSLLLEQGAGEERQKLIKSTHTYNLKFLLSFFWHISKFGFLVSLQLAEIQVHTCFLIVTRSSCSTNYPQTQQVGLCSWIPWVLGFELESSKGSSTYIFGAWAGTTGRADCWLECLRMASAYGLDSLTMQSLKAVRLLTWRLRAPSMMVASPLLAQPWTSQNVTSAILYCLKESQFTLVQGEGTYILSLKEGMWQIILQRNICDRAIVVAHSAIYTPLITLSSVISCIQHFLL